MRASALHIGGRAIDFRHFASREFAIACRIPGSGFDEWQSEASRVKPAPSSGTVNHREKVMLTSLAIIAVALLVPVVIFLPSLSRIDE